MGRRLEVEFVFRFIFFPGNEWVGVEGWRSMPDSFFELFFFWETNGWAVEGWRSMSDSFFVLFFSGNEWFASGWCAVDGWRL